MMAVIRVALLLDNTPKKVSYQTVYHKLKREDVQAALIARVFRDDISIEEMFGRGPKQLIADYLELYSRIDWLVHARLKHFRNLGVAHLSQEPLTKSITYDELRNMATLVAKLGDALVALCRADFASIESMLEDWSARGFSSLKFSGARIPVPTRSV